MRAPRNLGTEYGKQYDAIFPRLATEYDLVLMPFLLEGVAMQPSLNQTDQIHPNRAGYTIVVKNLMQVLEGKNLIIKELIPKYMRYQSLDTLRGLAIIGMILFHANYMLEEIFAKDIFHFSDLSWYILGRVVAIVFISVSGISLCLSIQNRARYQIATRTRQRFMILTTIALIISCVTYIFFYEQRISFGIIHFFAVVTVLGLPFIGLESWNILVGIVCLLIGYILNPISVDTDILIPL
jgi:predicted acyltransferase